MTTPEIMLTVSLVMVGLVLSVLALVNRVGAAARDLSRIALELEMVRKMLYKML